MRIRPLTVAVALTLATGAASAQNPAEEPSLFVLDVAMADGLDPNLAVLVRDLMVTNLKAIGGYRLTTSNDIQAMLGLEQQKQLAGCDDQSCLAEIMGALGAGLILGSNLARLGDRKVLTLRLIDARETKLENQLSETLPEEDDALIEVVKAGTYNLMRVALPKEESPWYTSPWLWTAVGVVVAGAAVVAGYFLFVPSAPPDSPLGTVVVDAR